MISRQQWDAYDEDEKWEYLFRHTVATEQNLERLGAALQRVRDRLDKLEAEVEGNAATPQP